VFHGSIPAPMRQMICEVIGSDTSGLFAVGCSGNFTVERILWSLGARNIWSNDITIYTSAIGSVLSDGDGIGLKYKEDCPPHMEWIKDYVGTPTDDAATLMLLSTMGWCMMVTKKPTDRLESKPYHHRMFKAYRSQFDTLHAKTKARLDDAEIKLNRYDCMDVMEWIDSVPQEATAIMFPPFYAGDYENMFKHSEIIFDWDAPTFGSLDHDAKNLLIDKVTSKDRWFLGLHEEWPELEEYYRGFTQTSNRGIPIYIYTNIDTRAMVRLPHNSVFEEPYSIPPLSPDCVIGDEIRVEPIHNKHFGWLRAINMAKHIRPSSIANMPTAVLVKTIEGEWRTAGVCALDYAGADSTKSQDKMDKPSAYMLSDFPVNTSAYPRLSKLIVMVAGSHEVSELLMKRGDRRYRSIVTTAFTKRESSMKYRGVMKKFTFKPIVDPIIGPCNMINYFMKTGQYSLQEALDTWKKRHGKRKKS
jgi:hypothetical protein